MTPKFLASLIVIIFLSSFSILLSSVHDVQAIPLAPVITTPSQTTNNQTPTIQGTAQGLSNVKLFDGATQIGSTTATGGSLTFSITNNVVGSAANAVVVSDFNNDGKQDVAVARSVSGTGQVSVKLGTGTGTFGATTNFGVGSQPNSIAAGDFNGDGKQDLATGNYNSNNISILLGTGTGSFNAGTPISSGGGATSIAVGDFNGDGKQDLALAYYQAQSIPIYLGTGTGTFTFNGNIGSALNGIFSVVVGDFNGDGKKDLASANGNGKISVFLGNGVGGFSFTSFNAASNPNSISVGDFNGDGKQDLVDANNGAGNVSVFLGTGTGTFGAATNFATGTSPVSVVVGDFNGDGKKDLAVTISAGSKVAILLGTGTGSFSAPSNFNVGLSFGDPRQIALGDFNGDGRQDLVTANFDGGSANGNFSILLNTLVSPWSIVSSTLSDGAHSIRATATDGTGTSQNSNIITVTVDSTAPDTTITSNPTNPSNSLPASFSFTSTESGTFECQIDGGGFSACTSPKSYSSLSDGSHTFNVRAKDSLGNTDPTPATYTWTVDTIAPMVSFVSLTPSIVGGSSQVSITKIASDAVGISTVTAQIKGPSPSTAVIGTVSLSLNSGTTQSGTWTGTFTFPSQATAPDGIYAIDEQVTDSAGNTMSMTDGMITVDRTAPTISVISITPSFLRPTDLVTVTASASDLLSGVSSVTAQDSTTGNTPASLALISGSTSPAQIGTFQGFLTGALPEGFHNVKLATKDNAVTPNENSITVSNAFTVDATPPVLVLPPNTTLEATSYSGAIIVYSASATDNTDGIIPVTCNVSSDTMLPFGTTSISCSATDAAGNTSSGSFTTTVVDTTAPTLNLSTDISQEATGPSGAQVTYSATASDIVDGDIIPTCTPISDSTFSIGLTTVNCSATDAHSNTSTGSFNVNVVDTTGPTLTLPSDITTEATAASGASVDYSATATDIVDGNVTPTCTPASGSTFPLGSTTVNCSASDGNSNTSTGSFVVNVEDTTEPTIQTEVLSIGTATSSGAPVTYSATASDIVDGTLTPTCTPASGSTFPLGSTTVNCSVSDAHGNLASSTFFVTVFDNNAPIIMVPEDVTEEATGSDGAPVTYSATASDLVDGDVTTSCSPSSGSTFPLGQTTVNCSASDAAANTSHASFAVNVVDTTKPEISVPLSSMTVEATGSSGAPVTYSATASDIVDGTLTPTCTPASGSTFPLGSTTVNCSATDAHGNTETASFDINVVDTTIPTLQLPSDITAEATAASGAPVAYSVTASDLVDGSITSTCAPSSGSIFPLGSTIVNCSAIDSSANTFTGQFTITVVDTTSPNTTISSAVDGSLASVSSGGTTSSNSITFAFAGTDNVGVTDFQCRLDSGVFASCTSPATYTGLITGSHTFNVKAIDGATNVDPTPATFGWSVSSDLTIKQKIQNIIDQVQDLVNKGVLNKGQGNSLIVKLDAAIKSLDNGNAKTTSNQLKAFTNEASALMKSKGLTAQLQPLINQANSIIAQLQA